MTNDRVLMNPRPSGKTKVKGKKADNSIIDMLTFDPDLPVANTNGNQLSSLQDIQSAAADKASYHCFGTDKYIALSVAPAAMEYGLSNFTSLITIKPTNITIDQSIRAKLDGGSFGFFYQLKADGTIKAYSQSTGVASTNLQTTDVLHNGESHTVALTRSVQDANETLAIFLDGILSKSTTGLAHIWPTSNVNNIGYAGTASGVHYSRLLEFNYVLPAAKIAKYSAGMKLDWEDIGGSMVNSQTVNGNFEGTFTSGLASGWAKVGTNQTNSQITGRSGAGSAQRTTVGAIVDNDVGIYQSTLTVGKSYRISVWVRASRAGIVIKTQLGGGLNGSFYTIQQANTWELFTGNRFFADSVSFYVYADTGFQTGDTIDFDDVIEQVGCVLALEPEGITSTKWLDSSGNLLHGTVMGALANNDITGTWTPVWSATGTAPSLGNGTISGRYTKTGDLINYKITMIAGSTTTFGTGWYGWSMPFPRAPLDYANGYETGTGAIGDSGTGSYAVTTMIGPVNASTISAFYGTAITNLVGPTIPMTFAAGDFIVLTGSYRI